MTVVLVHGVPETPSVWDPLRAALRRQDVRAVRLPGFGCPRPGGFGATKEEYVAWLAAELESMGVDEVDLVGHDWGGGLVVRLVSLQPELVRSWVTDAPGLAHPGFRWHDVARLWQAAGAGEQFFEQIVALPVEARAEAFAGIGVPQEHAVAMVREVDAVMGGCILDLYRSAVHVAEEWSPAFTDIPVPGLALVPSEDPYLAAGVARASAARAGAAVAELTGLGHWWMLQDPAAGAARLEKFWSEVAK
ncbi:alpha/beta fold hydrolase [Nonomuraea gerenzanensis]|uniref:Alpha/beta hydrolase, putative n=1 Tax=Nonomuraea gerenzanensis TaxID=93944 RepID=A0A1M4EFW9_9ACTN|nr:alpha/beta hydrolase [Nonomuraea gerenzanensis]UBU09058.1 alpha/beta hydrolase [Nonomuraea gerenzanensis]SBO97443.1 alpha/beta hydrolase, putative [Nonomuraea gerenzanensis]